MRKKLITAIIALTLVLTSLVGITVAWLSVKTDTVTNTFTPSDITITLDESKNLDLQMVPGQTITKDPVVTVEGGSEACWLFVKIEKSANFDNFIKYAVDSDWTLVPNTDNVYARQVSASDNDQEFGILAEGSYTYDGKAYTWADNQVLVMPEVNKTMMKNLTTESAYPKMTFTAYAIQQAGFDTAAEAWAEAQKLG